MGKTVSREEQETIITFDETQDDAIVFTYNARWIRRIEQGLGIKPSLDNGFGGKEYYVPKARIRLPVAPPKVARVLSPEQRQKLAQQLARGRQQKPPQVS